MPTPMHHIGGGKQRNSSHISEASGDETTKGSERMNVGKKKGDKGGE